MEGGVSIDIGAVDIHLVFFQERNDIMDVSMCDPMKQDVAAYLFDFT
eukprot:CAMPEP_0170557100 /NCGR_PEP_ID=MMETSP0211-20121228/19196_1 /TAXON_ID=311385 /ORGANISM="Pseudokeronopsis sp., Strain OXSARD2" /LENGTH=46 /DNA_ID= /DNA_START= /DNA_END= /DNA_ORIENTATION=